MSPEQSVSRFLDAFEAGDEAVVQSLWERSSGRLVRLARKKLRNTVRQLVDDEDVDLSGPHGLCLKATSWRRSPSAWVWLGGPYIAGSALFERTGCRRFAYD